MRWQVRPISLGLGSLFAYDLVLYADATLFRALDPALWTARGIAHAFVVPVIGVAAARNRDWSFDVALSRGVLVGSTTVLGAAAYLLGIAVLGYYVRFVGGDWGATLAIALTFGAGLLLALVLFSGTFRSKLRVLVAKNFFAYRYDYREEWLNFTRLIVAGSGGRSLHAQCIQVLGNLVETSSGAIWLRRDGVFVQVERNGLPATDTSLEETDELPSFLRSTGWVIDVQEALRDPDKYRGVQLPPALARGDLAWLIVPLPFGDQLIGFVVLGRPRVDFKLDWEVHDLLKTAGRQAASYIAQAQATEHLLEARKFDAFNRMSAFVVHDLKNLIAQLQLMLRNAERHAANPDFQRDMLKTVEHVVSRMNNLMQQLRAGEQPVDRAHVVDLCSIAEKVASVRAAGRSGLEIDTHARVFALGHEDRLERVIGHLVQNAFDSIAGAPSVALRVYADGDIAVIEVQDNGAGMDPEFIRERLFKPFNSTKQAGMGIGTYESQQYVASVGGRIAVSSEPGVGTTFRVYLRRAEAPMQVDHVIA
jgi:putative PEP-CTERM system histidine kinase